MEGGPVEAGRGEETRSGVSGTHRSGVCWGVTAGGLSADSGRRRAHGSAAAPQRSQILCCTCSQGPSLHSFKAAAAAARQPQLRHLRQVAAQHLRAGSTPCSSPEDGRIRLRLRRSAHRVESEPYVEGGEGDVLVLLAALLSLPLADILVVAVAVKSKARGLLAARASVQGAIIDDRVSPASIGTRGPRGGAGARPAGPRLSTKM